VNRLPKAKGKDIHSGSIGTAFFYCIEALSQAMKVLPSFRHALLLLIVCCSHHAAAQWFGNGAVELGSNDNVSRSPVAQQEHSDQSLRAGISGGYHFQVADYTGLTIDASLTREQFRRYSGLSSNRVALGGTLSHKFGLGERAPIATLGMTTERAIHNLSLRNSWLYLLQAGVQQRLADKVLLRLSLEQQLQRGDYNRPRPAPAPPMPGDVWKLDLLVASATVEWDTGPASWLVAGMQLRHGDTVASVEPSPRFRVQSSAVTVDPVFGTGIVSYRLNANTRLFSLDWNLATSDRSTLYIGAERQLSRGGTDLTYQAGIIRTGFIVSY